MAGLWSRRQFLACLGGGWVVAACGPIRDLPAPPERAARPSLSRFQLQGRLSLKTAQEAFSGRFSWSHGPEFDELDILSPLGQTVAELRRDAQGADLLLADGRRFNAPRLDQLAQQVFGEAVPLDRVPDWVLGRVQEARVSRDAWGRVLRCFEAGWQVDMLSYESDAPNALPKVVSVVRGDVELRLRLDQWDEVS